MEKLAFPNRIGVELTSRCNLKCTFCNRYDMEVSLGNMKDELFKKIVDEMAEHKPIAMVPFFRGESLLHPHFFELMRYAKDKGIGPIQFTSNGLALTEDRAEKLLDLELDFISFSLDTLDEQLYLKSRLHGDLAKSMHNVLHFIELCQERRKKSLKTPTIQVSTIDTPAYKAGKDAFVKYWRQYADIVRVYVEHDDYGGFRDKEVQKQFAGISHRPCRKLFNELVILYDGSIALCCYDWYEKHKIGDVNQQSLAEIWNGKPMEDIRRMSNEGTFTPDYICADCEHWKAGYIKNGYLGETYRKVDA